MGSWPTFTNLVLILAVILVPPSQFLLPILAVILVPLSQSLVAILGSISPPLIIGSFFLL